MELLTGECKKKFEEWYLKGQHNDSGYHNYLLRSLYRKELAMQYGVLVDFFDSEGIEIFVKAYNPTFDKKVYYFIITDSRGAHLSNHSENRTETRPQARKQAIQKANELFNNK